MKNNLVIVLVVLTTLMFTACGGTAVVMSPASSYTDTPRDAVNITTISENEEPVAEIIASEERPSVIVEPTDELIDKKIESVLAFDVFEDDSVFYSVRAYNESRQIVWEYNTEKTPIALETPFFNYCRFSEVGQIMVFYNNNLKSLDINTGEELWNVTADTDYCDMGEFENSLYFYNQKQQAILIYNGEGALIGSNEGDRIPINYERPSFEEEKPVEQTTETVAEPRDTIGNSYEYGDDYKEAYGKVLQHFVIQIGSGEEWLDPAREYTLYDFDSDGIPELIVHFGSRDKTSYYYIYCFSENHARLISGNTDVYEEDSEDAIDGRDYLYGACEKGVIAYGYKKGYEWAYLYSLSGHSIEQNELFIGEIGEDGVWEDNLRELLFFDLDDISGLNWSGNPEYDNYDAIEPLIWSHNMN